MTPPYFHDGSVLILPEAVKVLASVQLGVTPNDVDLRDIVAFLESLTGELTANFATVPPCRQARSFLRNRNGNRDDPEQACQGPRRKPAIR
jgi:cytochrome c peroxidase